MARHTFKILHLLQDIKIVSSRFGTSCIKRLILSFASTINLYSLRPFLFCDPGLHHGIIKNVIINKKNTPEQAWKHSTG